MQVRLGRIYTLERSSRESRDDYGEFMEILTALIRQRVQGADHVAADAPPSPKDNTTVRKSYRMCPSSCAKSVWQTGFGVSLFG